jgi:outer membrane lipoprotein carrier protein
MFKRVLFAISLFASPVISCFADEKAVTIIEEDQAVKQQLMVRIANLSAFSADFTQQVFDADGNSIQQDNGSLAVSKPNLLRWQINQPNESLIVSDGKALWLYDPFIEQVSIYAIDGALSNTPILLLADPEQKTWQNYTVELINKNHYLIKSKDSNSQVKSLELTFTNSNKNSSLILSEFVIIDATGQLSRVRLKQVKKLTNKQNEIFTFSLPQGVDVDDQR